MDADLRMMLDMEVRPLVIDNGSGAMKAGFAGEDSPRCIIPTVLARDVPHTEDTSSSLKEDLNRSGSFQGKKGRLEKKRNSISASRQVQEKSDDGGANSVKVEWNLIGDEAMGIDRSNGSISASAMSYSFNANSIKNFGHVSKLGSNRDEAHINDLLYPMVQGKVDIDAWDKMEKVFDSIFSHPKINSTPETQNILLSEASENGKDHRERMAEIMFEKYKVAGLYFSLQPVLSLYAQGRTTGLVLDVGHHLMQAVPVYEGFALNHAIHRSHFGGADLTEYMKEMLRNKLSKQTGANSYKMPFTSLHFHKVAIEMKEKLCVISNNYDVDKNSHTEKEYMLPDRKTITITHEAYTCAEALFNPTLIGKHHEKTLGVHQAVLHVYNKCDDHIKKLLAKNVVLSGGSTMFEGMKARLSKELNALPAQSNTSTVFTRNPNTLLAGNTGTTVMKVKDPSERKFSCWIGGSILASLPTFQQLWIQKADYDEHGAKNIVFSKCF